MTFIFLFAVFLVLAAIVIYDLPYDPDMDLNQNPIDRLASALVGLGGIGLFINPWVGGILMGLGIAYSLADHWDEIVAETKKQMND